MSNLAKVEFLEMADKLCQQIDKDYQAIIKFKDSWEELKKKADEKLNNYHWEWVKIRNFWDQHVRKTGMDFGEVRGDIVNHEAKWTSLSLQIYNIIKKNFCDQCKSKLSLDNIHVYSLNKKAIKKWAIDQVMQFQSLGDWEIRQSTPLFCSENCFQKSSYSQQNSSEPKPSQSQKTNQNQPVEQTPKQTNTWKCHNWKCSTQQQKKSGSYFYNTQTNDNKKLCSEACYLEEYGLYCSSCKQKFLTYHSEGNFAWCLPCWEKLEQEKQEQKEKTAKLQKDLVNAMTKVARGEGEKNSEVSAVEDNNPKNISNINNVNDISMNSDLNNRERERERDHFRKINQKIKLENEHNKTSEEQAKLINLKAQLAKTNHPAVEVNKNQLWIYWTFGFGGIGLVILIWFLVFKKLIKNQ